VRKTALIGAAAAALAAAPAVGQINWVNFGLWAGNYRPRPPGVSAKCYDGRWQPKPEEVSAGPRLADAAIHNYLRLAAAGTDLTAAFNGSDPWRLLTVDETEFDVRAAQDPWAARTARIEPIGFQAGNYHHGIYRALWRAVGPDGTPLGIYDGSLIRIGEEARFMRLRLYSPGAANQPPPLLPFCLVQGDIEKWRKARERRKAELAAQRAARVVDPATR
jgi:hypothetical protein